MTAEGRLKEMEKAVGQQVGEQSRSYKTNEQLYHAFLGNTVSMRLLLVSNVANPFLLAGQRAANGQELRGAADI